MSIRSGAVWILAAIAAAGACTVAETPQVAAQGASRSASPASGQSAAPADATTRKVVEAASAFIASLDATQKQAVQFAFNDSAQRARWSNFPVSIVPRAGVRWGDLNVPQRAALMELLGAVLSPEGVKMVREQMDADDELKNNPGAGRGPGGGGPPGGSGRGGRPPGGGLLFGSDLYYVAFLGPPSLTSPWMLQFGGHHLGINATVVGPNITIAPSLTGGQPVKYAKDGKPIYIVEQEVKQAAAMLNGLTPDQRGKAVISTRGIDLVLGPGHDGQTLQPEGLPASEMTQAQKDQFLALIESRLGIFNADDLAVIMADVRKNLNQTYFAWYGPTTDAGSAYFRATGPSLVLEFSPQSMGGDASNHLHNMYRHPGNDYGAAWTPLK
jgi:hypothetical protein